MKFRQIFYTVFLLFVFLDLSIFLSLQSSDYAAFIGKFFFSANDNYLYYSIFYSYPVVLGIILTCFNPRFFGWTTGKIREEWKLSLQATLIILLPIFSFLQFAPPTPFHGMSWQVFILAPVGEEAIFRGAFFTAIFTILGRFHKNENTVALLTILFSALCFGAWHIPNFTVQPEFTLFQIFYTTLIGIILGFVRYRTHSIYVGVFIHTMINVMATIM